MNPIQKLEDAINSMIIDALTRAHNQGLITYEQIPEFIIEVPRDSGHGDFASNVAMLLARQARMAPRQIADIIRANMDLDDNKLIDKIEVAGAGFLNFYLSKAWLYEIPQLVISMGDKYGYNPSQNKKVQVEFVSANPTGNLHMGNARGGSHW